MKKAYLILIFILVSFPCFGQWNRTGGSSTGATIVEQADCSSIIAGFCVDTDDGILYYWDGDSVETGSAYDDSGDGTITDATPTFICNDSDDSAGTCGFFANSSGGANDMIWSFGVEDSAGASTEYFQIDGVTETIDFLKPVTFATGWSITGTTSGGQYLYLLEDTDNTADNYSGWGIYGELAHSTIYALPLAAPAAGQVMSFAAPGNQTMSDGSTQSVSVGTNVYKDQSQTPLAGAAADFDDNCTGQCLYGGTYRVSTAGTVVIPNATVGMNFTITDAGDTPTIEPLATGTDDTIINNETSCGQGVSLVSGGTTGSIASFQYGGADTWIVYSNGFACGS